MLMNILSLYGIVWGLYHLCLSFKLVAIVVKRVILEIYLVVRQAIILIIKTINVGDWAEKRVPAKVNYLCPDDYKVDGDNVRKQHLLMQVID